MTGAGIVVVGLAMMSTKPVLMLINYRRWHRESVAESARATAAVDPDPVATFRRAGL